MNETIEDAPDGTIPNVWSSESPAVTRFKGNYYVAHQGSPVTATAGTLCYTISDNGTSWGPDVMIPGVAMSGSPAIAVFDGTLYIAHRGSEDPSQIWYTTSSDGTNWTADTHVPGVWASASPSLMSFNGYLYLAYLGSPQGNQKVWYARFDGSNWSASENPIPNVTTPFAPALGVYNDKSLTLLYLDPSYSLMTVFSKDGQNWSAPPAPFSDLTAHLSAAAPASTYAPDLDYAVAFLTKGAAHVHAANGGHTIFAPICSAVGSPGVVTYNDVIYVAAPQSDGSIIFKGRPLS